MMESKTNKVKFLRNWTLLNAAFFLIGYALVILFGILMMEAFHLSMDEWGSPFLQTMWQIGNGILIGCSIGFIQWRLLRNTFNIPSLWIYLVPIGIIFCESIIGIILWKLDLNRGEFSFWENKPLHHALIATSYGLVIGLIQLRITGKYFSRSSFWILTSALAWGTSILITAIDVTNDIFLVIAFIIGILLYGLITGAALMWVLKPKEIK
jgi:hypothetical protein